MYVLTDSVETAMAVSRAIQVLTRPGDVAGDEDQTLYALQWFQSGSTSQALLNFPDDLWVPVHPSMLATGMLDSVLQGFVDSGHLSEEHKSNCIAAAEAAKGGSVRLITFIPPEFQDWQLTGSEAQGMGFEGVDPGYVYSPPEEPEFPGPE